MHGFRIDIVAQHNIAYGSRGHNDSAGIHVDFANQDVLVQYNFTYDNEGYGTEILGKNKNIIWRYNISVGDGTARLILRDLREEKVIFLVKLSL